MFKFCFMPCACANFLEPAAKLSHPSRSLLPPLAPSRPRPLTACLLRSYSDVPWPQIFLDVMRFFRVLQGDILSSAGLSCVVTFDFHDQLVFTAVAPTVLFALCGIGIVVSRCNKRSKHEDNCIKATSFLFYVSYIPIALRALQTFQCSSVDNGVTVEDYLSADFRIKCSGAAYESSVALAIVLLVVVVAGWPIGLALFLRRNRHQMEDKSFRRRYDHFFLSYKREYFYWDVVDMVRKLLMSGVLVFLGRGKPLQAAVGLLVGQLFHFLHTFLRPHNQPGMALVTQGALMALWLTPLAGLLIQIDTFPLDSMQQDGMGVLLLCLTIAVALLGFFCAFGYACIYTVKGLRKVDKRARKTKKRTPVPPLGPKKCPRVPFTYRVAPILRSPPRVRFLVHVV